MKRIALACLLSLACSEAEYRVTESRCQLDCARQILDSYDDGAPLSAEAINAWVAFCATQTGPCCAVQGGTLRRCTVLQP